MTENKKITKRDRFSQLLTFAEVKADPEMTAFIQHEIELLDKKNAAKGERKPTAQQEANAKVAEAVISYLSNSDKGMTITQLMKHVPGMPEDMSNQRMTRIVSQLVNDGRLKRDLIKRVAYFSAPA